MALTAEVMLIVIRAVATNDVVDICWKIDEKSINHWGKEGIVVGGECSGVGWKDDVGKIEYTVLM